jgi:alanine-synthesizing transaminase
VRAAEELEREGRKIIHLNIGDPQGFGFRPPIQIIEVVNRAVRDKYTGYANSSGLQEARDAVANYATNLGASTTPNDVIMTAGASEAADLVLTALLDPGDEVLLPAPGYPIYSAILNKLAAKETYYHLDVRAGWQPSISEVRSLIGKQTRAMVLINPSNPTGAITSDEITRAILEIAAEHNLLIISDEVYRELCFNQPPMSASTLATDSGAAVITLESLSKTHMLSGWRVGWMRFTNGAKMTELIAAITRLASGRLCSPTPAQYAVKPALAGNDQFVAAFTREIQSRRDFAVKRVRTIDGLSCSIPQAAFYLMIRVDDLGGRTDEEFVVDLLQESGVLVVHGSGFGCDPGDGYFRMVYLADEQLLGSAFDGLEKRMKSGPQMTEKHEPQIR